MTDNGTVISERPELHSFVKLSIAYLGIVAGFAAIGLGLFIEASRVYGQGDPSVPRDVYYNTIVLYSLLVAVTLLGIWQLNKRKKLGAYLTFAALILSLFVPSRALQPDSLILWFTVPSAVVGILLLSRLKTLS